MKKRKPRRGKNYKRVWKLCRKEFNTEYLNLTRDGELVVNEGNYQYNIYELARKYGTPLKIMFPYVIEQRVEDLMDLFKACIREYKYKGQFYYHYPMKVNQNREFVMPIISEGGNLETTSANELWIVKRLWEQNRFNSRIKVICNGPKTDDYLALIAELKKKGLDIVPIIEDPFEREALQKFRGQVGVRVALDVKIRSYWDKRIERFGLRPDEIYDMGRIHNLTLLHYHTGCEVIYEADMLRPLRRAMEIYLKLKQINPTLDTINIGGGFPVNYNGKEKWAISGLVHSIIRFMSKFCAENNLPHPNIICEWGSYMVAPAQMTVFSILNAKRLEKSTAKQWYVIDGSFQTHLLDAWAVHRQWHIAPVNNAYNQKLTRTWLAGLSCDSDDKYTAGGSYILLPRLEDLENGNRQLIAVLDTGNYQDGFNNHHCLNATPAKVVCQNGDVTLLRKRETSDDVGKLFGW